MPLEVENAEQLWAHSMNKENNMKIGDIVTNEDGQKVRITGIQTEPVRRKIKVGDKVTNKHGVPHMVIRVSGLDVLRREEFGTFQNYYTLLRYPGKGTDWLDSATYSDVAYETLEGLQEYLEDHKFTW